MKLWYNVYMPKYANITQYREKISLENVPETDWYYLAGIIDGEGSILIGRGTGYDRKRNKYKRYLCQVRVGMTCKPLVDWLQQTFEGGVYFKKSQRIQWKHQWNWVLGSLRLQELLTRVAPKLKIKQKQAYLALEYLERVQDNDPAWRDEMYLKMKALNKKGRLVETNTLASVEQAEMIESELIGDDESALSVTAAA